MNINTTDTITESKSKTNGWKEYIGGYQWYVTTSSTKETKETDEIDDKIVHMEDLEKRKEVYGTCNECNEPGTGVEWCQPCNAKRFKDNFKNWTSGNKDIDELIQQSQLNALYHSKCLEWVPFENFQNVTYITKGGFGKIYSAYWPEGFIKFWDIEEQKWMRLPHRKVALKSLNNSFDISTDFLNEIKSHLQIYLIDINQCHGITQDPDTKDYMMILDYCKDGNLRNYLNQNVKVDLKSKIRDLLVIASGLLNIHNAEKVHKDFHSGNILFNVDVTPIPCISDLGMCQPANNEKQPVKKEGVYGVLPYMAPEVLRGFQYTKASDIYSFGIVMNEFISGETPYNKIPHDHILAVKICKGLRPKISEDTPKLLGDLIGKCWDAKAENRPTSKELHQIFTKWYRETRNRNSEICSQIEECEKIRKNKSKNGSSGDEIKLKNIQSHPQAIYTSRLLNFKNLPEPINSECIDCQLSESDLNDDDDL